MGWTDFVIEESEDFPLSQPIALESDTVIDISNCKRKVIRKCRDTILEKELQSFVPKTAMFRLETVLLLAAAGISIANAGDACPLETRFCSCNQYPIQLPNLAPDTGSSILVKSIAVTTAPKTRDPFQHTVVECYLNGTQQTSLDTVASSLHRKLVDKLIIHGLPVEKEFPLARLPSEWLKNTRIKQFELTDAVLAGDFISRGNPFAGNEQSLIWLAAVDCSLTGALTYDTLGTVNIRGLERLSRLEGLDLSRNHLVTVEETAFKFNYSHPRLQTVVLSRNAIQEVMSGAFHRLQKLRHLDLSHNMLERVSRSIFSDRPKLLGTINFSWNRLMNLAADLFTSMPALRVVDASNNFLSALPELPWKSIWWRLQKVDLSGNFFECDCELLWMFPNASASSNSNAKRQVKGQCARTLPTLFVQHFDLNRLTRDRLDCEDGDDDYEGNDDYDLPVYNQIE